MSEEGLKLPDKVEMDYDCHWCGHKFKQHVGSCKGNTKHKKKSSQVQCKRCGNFLKTW